MNKIKIFLDNNSIDPRKDMDNLGIIISTQTIEDSLFKQAKENLLENDYNQILDNKRDVRSIKNILEKSKQFLIFNLYRYSHGNSIFEIADSNPFNCQFDSGQIGFVVVAKNKIRQEYSCKKITKSVLERVEKVIKAEIKNYTDAYNGDIYGFQVIHNGEEDSCGGFIGSDFETNGILDYIPEKFHNALRNNGFPVDEWLDVNGNEVSEDEEELEDELMYA